jgi:hypothetical protein
MDRRKFLGVVGAGSAAASAAAIAAASHSAAASAPAASSPAQGRGGLNFRAETGLPGRPWPAYATAVAEGSIDLGSGTGFVATRVLAGQPGNGADIALPGTARLVRITAARADGSSVFMQGMVEDRSSLAPGESASKTFVLDQAARQLRTELAGTGMSLTLVTAPLEDANPGAGRRAA